MTSYTPKTYTSRVLRELSYLNKFPPAPVGNSRGKEKRQAVNTTISRSGWAGNAKPKATRQSNWTPRPKPSILPSSLSPGDGAMSLPTTPAQMKFNLQQSQDKQVMNLEQLRKYLVALEARVKVLEAKP